MVATCKAASTLTVAGEAQWQHDDDDGVGVDSYGATGYLSYALTPELAASLRGEVHRDNAGFFVLVHPGNLDATRASNGLPDTSSGEARQPCSERAWGVSYRPAIPHVALLAFRPDTRWNKSFSGGHPCIAGRQTGRFTVACGRDPRLPGKDARRGRPRMRSSRSLCSLYVFHTTRNSSFTGHGRMPSHRKKGCPMFDIFLLVLGVGTILLMDGYASLCDRI